MRIGLSWLREHVKLPADLTAAQLDTELNALGVATESVVDLRATVGGDLVIGRVLSIEELAGYKKPIRFCTVDVGAANGSGQPQEIVCGATNFAVGDLVVVILPGGVLPGGFEIGARKTYGRNSNGMICSARELGLGDDHSGIIVLDPATAAAPGSAAQPGADARPVVGLDDIVVEVEITPDRGYQMSARGLARELAHAFDGQFTDPGLVKAPKGTKTQAWPVSVVDQVGCDRFAARLVRGVDPAAPTPQWMSRRLATAGIRVLGLAIDITNYVMLELGQPMHAFDADRIAGGLVVRRANDGEKVTTLDGVARVMSAEDMVICDDSGPISLAAVMGGQTSEVIPGATVNVLFEAAHWDPTMVGRTARRHRLFSEAAKRWERGVDRKLCLVAIERAVRLLEQYGDGKAGKEILDLDYPAGTISIELDPAAPGQLIGVDYSLEQVVSLLETTGSAVTVGGGVLMVTPPSWRPDLLGVADLIEEVVRLDGLDKVPSLLPTAPAGRGLTPIQRRRRSIGRTLAEQGYVEVLSYPFVSATALAALGLSPDAVALANPISEEEPLMRPSLLPPLLAALRRNVGRGQRDVALFEQGLVFQPAKGERPPVLGVQQRPSPHEWDLANAAVPRQPWHVAVVLAGEVERSGWWGAGRGGDWSDAIQAGRDVLAAAGIAPGTVDVTATAYGPWHPGRCAALAVGGVVIGYAGELHPAVCAALELPKRTAAMELDLDAVPLPPAVPPPSVSPYPPAFIDVALVVAASVPAAAVEAALVSGAGGLLESVRLFDVYSGAQVAEGFKSLAYKLVFRAKDRTLTAEEAIAARDGAVAAVAASFGATLRGA